MFYSCSVVYWINWYTGLQANAQVNLTIYVYWLESSQIALYVRHFVRKGKSHQLILYEYFRYIDKFSGMTMSILGGKVEARECILMLAPAGKKNSTDFFFCDLLLFNGPLGLCKLRNHRWDCTSSHSVLSLRYSQEYYNDQLKCADPYQWAQMHIYDYLLLLNVTYVR